MKITFQRSSSIDGFYLGCGVNIRSRMVFIGLLFCEIYIDW